MTRQVSYSKYENELKPGFREKMDQAESTEDVKKFFTYTVQELLDRAIDNEEQEVEFREIELDPAAPEGYALAESLRSRETFISAWSGSDLPRIVADFARDAVNRYQHLDKNPEKTESKMFRGMGEGAS